MALTYAAAAIQVPADTEGVPLGYTQSVGYLRCNTLATNTGCSTPDHADLDITGDMEIVVRVSLDDWTPGALMTLLAKRSGSHESYHFYVTSAGGLGFAYSSSGAASTSVSATSTLSTTDGTCIWVRLTFDADNGAAGTTTRFYWQHDSDDEPYNWQQLGTDVVTATAVTLFNGTATLRVGARSAGATQRLTGNVYRAMLRNAIIGGTTVFDADFTLQAAGTTSFTEATGKTVSIEADASISATSYTWRVAIQMLAAEGSTFANGARWGTAKWDTSAWSSYEWSDLTADVTGAQWSRGKALSGQGFPRADVGTLNLQLQDSGSSDYQPWATGGGNLNREMRPGALVRIVAFRPGAICTLYSPGNGFSTICRVGVKPLFTGVVDQWNYSIENGRHLANITANETLSILAAVTKPAVASAGSGDTLIARLVRLLVTDPVWSLPIVDSGQYMRASFEPFTSTYTLQATTLASNRLAEVNLSAESILNVQIVTDGDGSLKVGVPPASDAVIPKYAMPLVRFQNRTFTLASDATSFPYAKTAYYQDPLVVSSDTDYIINSVSATRVGGAAQTATSTESIGLYGTRSYNRTDLLCIDDTVAGFYADSMVSYDGYNPTHHATADQSLQPGQMTFTNQFAARLAITLHAPAIIDIYGTYSYPDIRMIGRITSMRDSLTRSSDGMTWQTTVSMFAITNYKPTS